MIAAERLFEAVQLAEASYTLLERTQVRDDTQLAAAVQNGDLEGDFSAAQAQSLVNSWLMAHHQPDTPSGFSATLFQKKC